MFALVSCSVKTSVRQAQFGAATVSSKLLFSFCSTSFCCQWTTTLMTTGCSLLRGQCNQLALCWIEAVEVLGYHWKKGRSTLQLCRFPCWVCPLMLSTAKRFARTRKNENRALSKSLSLKSSARNEFNLRSFVDKLVFVGKGVSGRVGVHARRPLYQALKDFSIHREAGMWPAHVLEAIAVCAGTLCSAPPRTLRLDWWQWPSAVLYGDAALSTRRLAAILYIPETCVGKPELVICRQLKFGMYLLGGTDTARIVRVRLCNSLFWFSFVFDTCVEVTFIWNPFRLVTDSVAPEFRQNR